MEKTKLEVLRLLQENARLTNEQIARRLGIAKDEAAGFVKELERDKIVLGYRTVVDPEAMEQPVVEAIIEVRVTPRGTHGFDEIARKIYNLPEVQSLYLSSGKTDFLVMVEAPSIKDVSEFLTEKLATLEDVVGTTTHFMLKKYKKDGIVFENITPAQLAVAP